MAQRRETARHQDAFEAWYAASRDYRKTSGNLTIPDGTLRTWADWFNWRGKADKRDAEAILLADRDAVKRRAAMLKRHRQAAELLTTRGIEHFSKHKIDSARDAIAALKTGVEMERQAEGLPNWVVELLNADEDQLRKQFADLDARRRTAVAGLPDSPGDALAAGNGHARELQPPRTD